MRCLVFIKYDYEILPNNYVDITVLKYVMFIVFNNTILNTIHIVHWNICCGNKKVRVLVGDAFIANSMSNAAVQADKIWIMWGLIQNFKLIHHKQLFH